MSERRELDPLEAAIAFAIREAARRKREEASRGGSTIKPVKEGKAA